MAGVEWVDADPVALVPPDDAPPAVPPAPRSGRLLAAGAGAGLAAAVLLVVGASARLFALRVRIGGTSLTSLSYDGWGRDVATSQLGAGGHGPRYGIVLVAAAALVAVGTAVAVVSRRRRPSPTTGWLALAAVVLGAGAALGVAAAVVLEGQWLLAANRATAAQQEREAFQSTITVRLELGPFVPFAVAGGLLALAAVVLCALAGRGVQAPATPATPAAPTAPGVPAPPHRDDELLG